MDQEPGIADIIDHLEGRLDPERAEAVANHLARAADAGTADAAAWLRRFQEAAAGVTFTAPPAGLIARLHQLMPAGPTLIERLAAASGELLARLVQDLTPGPMLAGARGEAATGRQLLFEADDGTEITLRLVPGPEGRLAIDGQIFGDDPDRHLVITDTTGDQATQADAAGEFTFPSVSAVPGADLVLRVDPGTAPIRVDLSPYIPSANLEQT